MSESNIPFWGQAYELTVSYSSDSGQQSTVLTSNAWEPEALRMEFEVQKAVWQSPWWFADITVYNLNVPSIQNIILKATWVTLKAGFQYGSGLYATIWDGPVLQILLDRRDVTDIRVTFHCVASPANMAQVSYFNLGPGATQQQALVRMAAQLGMTDLSVEAGTLSQKASDQLSAKSLPRGKTVFGKPGDVMDETSEDQNLLTWRDGLSAYMSDLSNSSNLTPNLIYCPPVPYGSSKVLPSNYTASVIGTPRQIAQGVIFNVLLDPRLVVGIPPLLVQLDNVIPSQIAVTPKDAYVAPLDNTLTFFVGQVRHMGDTRGNVWQSEVTGYTTTYAESLTNGIFSGSSAPGGS